MTPSIAQIARQLRTRTISCVELVQDSLTRIEQSRDLNAFVHVMARAALKQARIADRELAAGVDRGPLHGVPISVKDLIDIAGTPTTAASRVLEGHVATATAPAVSQLRRAGAIVVGKTNLHEFAFGPTNEDSAFGPTLNPYDSTRCSGGSSGGSAVSVATRAVVGSLGTDTGGSIRIPAAACGVVGLKPSYGEIRTDGVVPLSTTLDHVGPIGRDVADAAALYAALLGDVWPLTVAALPMRSIRLGVPRPYFFDVLDKDVRSQFELALDDLRSKGASVIDLSIAGCDSIAPTYMNISFAEAAAYHARYLEAMPDRYTAPVRSRLESARRVMAEDYVRALSARERLRQEVEKSLSTCDALVLPTLPIPAPALGSESVTVDGREHPVRPLLLRLTQLFNLTGHPAITLPCGLTGSGLPCGLQLVGKRLQTHWLLSIALGVEGAIARRTGGVRRPRLAKSEQRTSRPPLVQPSVDAHRATCGTGDEHELRDNE